MKKNILIILLAFIVVGLIGFITYDNFFKPSTNCDVEETTEKTTVVKNNEKNTSTTSEGKETRYYQYVSPYTQEASINGEPMYMTTEIELNADGTATIAYYATSDVDTKKGIYVEDDKYIILELNNIREQCTDDNYQVIIADSCTDNIILIKDGDVLKNQRGALYHFEIDNVNNSIEFLKVNKTDLKTELKD